MDNVVSLHPDKRPCCIEKSWEQGIKEYCEGYKQAEPFSCEKVHFGWLLCQVIENEKMPMDLRREAGYAVYNYSDYRVALDHIFNTERLQEKKR